LIQTLLCYRKKQTWNLTSLAHSNDNNNFSQCKYQFCKIWGDPEFGNLYASL